MRASGSKFQPLFGDGAGMPSLVSSCTATQTCDNTHAVNCLALGIAHQEFSQHLSAHTENADPPCLRAALVVHPLAKPCWAKAYLSCESPHRRLMPSAASFPARGSAVGCDQCRYMGD